MQVATMWRIADYTQGRIWTALIREWGRQATADALEGSHCFGAATDIAQELAYLGFERPEDFDICPARSLTPALL